MRRDRLKRLVEAGRIEMVESYHFDDMMGTEQHQGQAIPVAMRPAEVRDRKEGICYLFASDFTSQSGSAYQEDNGTITLYVHSNCNYTLRIKPEERKS